MFAARYFAPRYFAERYFASIGAAAAPVIQPAPEPSGAGFVFPLPRVEPPRIGRIFSIVGEIHIRFEGAAAVVLIRGTVKTLQAAERLEYDDDEEILSILDDWDN